MNRGEAVQEICRELELLAALHIFHGLEKTPVFEARKKRLAELMCEHRVTARHDLDPVSRNLYYRYFS